MIERFIFNPVPVDTTTSTNNPLLSSEMEYLTVQRVLYQIFNIHSSDVYDFDKCIMTRMEDPQEGQLMKGRESMKGILKQTDDEGRTRLHLQLTRLYMRL